MNKKKTGILIAAAVLISAAIIFTVVQKNGTDADSTEGASNLQGVEAKPGSVSIKVEGPSVAEPYRVQSIRSQIEGIVLSVKEEDEAVKTGEILVELDRNDSLTNLKQAEINLSKAKLNRDKSKDQLDKAVTDLEGKKQLLSGGAISADQVTAAQSAVDAARYALQAAELDLAQEELMVKAAKINLDNTLVKAPFSGIILSSSLIPGDLVNKGSELITIADISKIKLTAEIDEFDIGKVKKGQKVSITSDSLGDKVLSSVVSSISPSAEIINNISIFKVTTVIRNSDLALKPGMSADISILIQSDKGLVVPSKAVSRVRTRSYIKVFEDGEIKTKRVTTGADNGISIVVLDGLEEGDLVVVEQAAGFSLSNEPDSAGSSVIPISVPGARK